MPVTDVIAVDNLGVTLGGVPVLREISLRVGSGEVVALLGGNGSGKTTLLKAILGLLPHSGEVTLFGTEQSSFRDWRRIGYVPQRATVSMHATTTAEVVMSGTLASRRPFTPTRARHRAVVADALTRVGLADRASELFIHLSGGQQQRVLIARALAAGADLLVLDEPLAGVDLRNQRLIAAVIADLNAAGTTVLVVLHETETFEQLIDRAIVLREGRVVSDGPPSSLLVSHRHEHEAPPHRPGLTEGINPQWNS